VRVNRHGDVDVVRRVTWAGIGLGAGPFPQVPGALLRNTEHLSCIYTVGILNLVAVRLEDYCPLACIAVILHRNARKAVATHDRVLREAAVRVEQSWPECDRHDNAV
jgi:hypothetical protein